MQSLTSGSFVRGAFALLTVILLAVGCSSSVGVTESAVVVADDAVDDAVLTDPTPTVTPPAPAPTSAQAQAQPQLVTNLPTVEQVAPELADLGTLIAVHSEPVQQTFDGSGGSLTLADGALVQVPTDSFTAPAEVTMVVTDLLFGKYLDDAPQGRIYRLATVEDVTLLRPMVLEIAKPAESVTVLMLEDGEWTEQTIPDLDTTRVEITHFSVNLVAIVDKADCSLPENHGFCVLHFDGFLVSAPDGFTNYSTINGHKFDALSDAESAACTGLCPTRTAPGAPAQGSTDQGSTDQGSTADSDSSATTDSDSSATTDSDSSTATEGDSSQPAPVETTTSSQGCQSPDVELERNGQKSCVSEAVCLSVGFGWSYQNGKCTGPPPCEGESEGHYRLFGYEVG